MNATPQELLALARTLMDQHGLTDWTVELEDRKTRHGACNAAEKKLLLRRSDVFWRHGRFVKDTILHEIAHALTPRDHGHGKKWRDVAYSIGVRDFAYGRWSLNAKSRKPAPPTDYAKKLRHAEAQAKRYRTRMKRCETAAKRWERRARLYQTKLGRSL